MKMRRTVVNRSFLFAISAIWILMMVLLVQRNLPTRKPEPEGVLYAEGDTTEWMSIYISGAKIGYIVSVTRETETGYEAIESSYMRFGLSGTDQDVKTFVRADSDTEYRMKSFSIEIRSKHQLLKSRGEVTGRTLSVQVESGGEIENLSFTLPEDAYLPTSIAPLIRNRGMKEGDSASITLFDPSLFQPAEMWIKHEGKKEIKHLGKTVEVAHLSYAYLGAKMDMYVDESGRVLKEEGPMGLLIVAEPKDMAEKFTDVERPVELLTLFSIPVTREIPNPRSLAYMKVELVGADLEPKRIANNRQRVVGVSPLTVEVSALGPDPQSPPEAADILEKYLAHEALLQIDSPRIKSLSDSIAGGITDPWEKTKTMAGWVNSNLEKSPTVSIPSALEVAASRRGDCNEHAVLLAALLRAADVPATIASGLVYIDGYFYYHAWNRVYVGSWVDVDATFGQEIADATHLLLSEGGLEDQASMTSTIGRLRIRILDAR
jgi:hypothetical protein